MTAHEHNRPDQESRGRSIEAMKRFLYEQTVILGREDSYRVYGGLVAPVNVFTLGDLREVLKAVDEHGR